MALTIPQIAYRIRLQNDETTTPEPSIVSELTVLKTVADEFIANDTPTAPESIKDEATILFISYVYDGPQEITAGGAALAYPSVWRNSGAALLLSRWRVRRAGIIGATAAAAAVQADNNPITGVTIEGNVLTFTLADGETINVNIPSTGGGGPGLSAGERASLDGSVALESIELVGRDLTFTDNSGDNSETITLPGIHVEDEGSDIGEVTEINFIGGGVTATRSGLKATVSITGGSGGGLSESQVDARVRYGVADWAEANQATSIPAIKLGQVTSLPDIVALREFQEGLQHQTTLLAEVRQQIAIGLAAVRLPGTPAVPAATQDAELLIDATPQGFSRELHNQLRVDISALLAKPAVSTTTQLSTTNAVEWTTANGYKVFIARSTDSPSQFLFSADTVGAYDVRIQYKQIDISDWARLSNTDQIPASKLPPTTGGGGGLTQAQVDERIYALDSPVDVIASKQFGFLNVGSDIGTSDLALAFTAGTTALTIGQVIRLADGIRISITIKEIGTRAALVPYHVRLNVTGIGVVDHVLNLAFADATYSEGDAPAGADPGNPDAYTWRINAPAWAAGVGGAVLSVYEPIGPENYVPEGSTDDDGKVLKRTEDGPAWGTISYSELEGLPSGHTLIQNAPITGVSVTNSSQDFLSNANPIFFNPQFDLDDYQNGEVHVSLEFTISQKSVTTLSLDGDDTARTRDIIFLSTLRAASVFVLGGSIEGVQIGDDLIVRNAGSQIGVLRVYLTRNSANQVGYQVQYDGSSQSRTFAVGIRMEMSVSPTDATGGGGGGGGLTQAQVDARVQAGVSDWAEQGNASLIPANKLTNAPSGGSGLSQAQVDARVQAGVLDWAETGNTDLIPSAKIPAGSGTVPGLVLLGTATIAELNANQRYSATTSIELPAESTYPYIGFQIRWDSGGTVNRRNIKTDIQIVRTIDLGTSIADRPVVRGPGVADDYSADWYFYTNWVTFQARPFRRQIIYYDRPPLTVAAGHSTTGTLTVNVFGVNAGLAQSQVDARVQAVTYNWAHVGNNDPISTRKLTAVSTPAQVRSLISARVLSWATTAAEYINTRIPQSKLPVIDHVGDLIATLNIPAGTPGLGLIQATWSIATGAPTGFSTTGRPMGQFAAPKSLPTGMQGVVLRATVAGTVTTEVYVPWTPGLATDGRFTANIARTYYVLQLSTAAPRRAVRFLVQRGLAADVLGAYGNQDALLATKLEVLQWV